MREKFPTTLTNQILRNTHILFNIIPLPAGRNPFECALAIYCASVKNLEKWEIVSYLGQ